jgi:hypothetical protein
MGSRPSRWWRKAEIMRAALVCLSSAIFFSCSRSVDTVSMSIKAVPDTVTLIRNPDQVLFRVSAIMRNADSRALVVSECGPLAQREISGDWVTIFMPICLASPEWILMPGDSAVIPAVIYGYMAPNTGPRLDPRMVAGRYRLLFGVALADKSRRITDVLPIDQRASSVFFVKDAP